MLVFWRGFFKSPKELEAPVKVLEQTKIYPLGKEATAKPMQFPDASGVPVNMLFPKDGSAFDMLKRAIDAEYVEPTDMNMRGMLAAIGIVKGEPFNPSAADRAILDKAARRAVEMARWTGTVELPRLPGVKYYKDRQWVNVFAPFPGTTAPLVPSYTDINSSTYNDINRRADWLAPTYTDIDLRGGFFSMGYSMSPVMAGNYVNMGAKYPAAFVDADGDPLDGQLAAGTERRVLALHPRLLARHGHY